MGSYSRLLFLSVAPLLAGAVACSPGNEATDDDGPGGSGAGGSVSSTSSAGPTGSTTSGFMGCQGTACGDGLCCDSGTEECVEDVCLPACASAVRCGPDLATCCATGEVCINDACTMPGGPCSDFADCEEDEFCEPTLGACLPQPDDVACEYVPAVGPLTPEIEWSWTDSPIQPSYNQVVNTPVVLDLEAGDPGLAGYGTPDVVFVTSTFYDETGFAYLRALDGATGDEKWGAAAGVYSLSNRVQPRVTPAGGDIDGDGFPEFITGRAGGGLIAFEHTGAFKWRSTNAGGGTYFTTDINSGAVALADLEGDGTVEIILGGAVFDAGGELKWNAGVFVGSSSGSYGAVSIVADLDGGGQQEVVSGRRAYHADGTLYWDNGLSDGYPAIADLDLDGLPEIVVISSGSVRVQAPTTGALLAQLDMPGDGQGGPPTIADFDADGVPEISAANGTAYSVFEYTPGPPAALSVKWSQVTQDVSSNRTGSSVFDFQGDGSAEVAYNDECYFRIYAGDDGAVLFEEPNASATIHEYPIMVDVDGDNNTEIVLTANDANHIPGGVSCPYSSALERHGIYVYGDAEDKWVRTRRVWNQHAYHITNVSGTGAVAGPEAPSWIVPPGLNNYRQSSQGAAVFNAPDLQVDLSVGLDDCPNVVELGARVINQGNLGVPAGVVVRFYRGTSEAGTFIGEAATTTALLPGQYEKVLMPYTLMASGDATMTFFVTVDEDDMGTSAFNECLEDNNAAGIGGVSCPSVQ